MYVSDSLPNFKLQQNSAEAGWVATNTLFCVDVGGAAHLESQEANTPNEIRTGESRYTDMDEDSMAITEVLCPN